MDRIPMTASGYKALEDEITHLKLVERPAVIKMITEARSHGDLSENAEYHAARSSAISKRTPRKARFRFRRRSRGRSSARPPATLSRLPRPVAHAPMKS